MTLCRLINTVVTRSLHILKSKHFNAHRFYLASSLYRDSTMLLRGQLYKLHSRKIFAKVFSTVQPNKGNEFQCRIDHSDIILLVIIFSRNEALLHEMIREHNNFAERPIVLRGFRLET